MLVIGIAALLLFGPKKLPELAKSLGKGIRDFKKAVSGEDEKPETPPPGQIEHQPTVTQNEKQKSEHKVD